MLRKDKKSISITTQKAVQGKEGCLWVQGLLSSSALLPVHIHTCREHTGNIREGSRRDAAS